MYITIVTCGCLTTYLNHHKSSFMKKYLFSFLAIALVIIGSAFIKRTTVTKKTEPAPNACIFFQFIGTATSESSVENPANWLEVSDITTGCDNVNHRACRICVKETAVQGTAPNRTLKPTAIINAAFTGPGGTWYVVAGPTGDVQQARNRS